VISLHSDPQGVVYFIYSTPLAKGVGEWGKGWRRGNRKLGRVCPQKSSLMQYRGKKGKGERKKEQDSALPVFTCFQGMSFWSCRPISRCSPLLHRHLANDSESTVARVKNVESQSLSGATCFDNRTTATTTCCLDASMVLAVARSAVSVEDIAAAWHLTALPVVASRQVRLRDRVGVSNLASLSECDNLDCFYSFWYLSVNSPELFITYLQPLLTTHLFLTLTLTLTLTRKLIWVN